MIKNYMNAPIVNIMYLTNSHKHDRSKLWILFSEGQEAQGRFLLQDLKAGVVKFICYLGW